MTDSAFWERVELIESRIRKLEGTLQPLTARQEKTSNTLVRLAADLVKLTPQLTIVQARQENFFNCLALLHQALSGAVGTGEALKRIQREMEAIHVVNSKGETWSLPNESPDAHEK